MIILSELALALAQGMTGPGGRIDEYMISDLMSFSRPVFVCIVP